MSRMTACAVLALGVALSPHAAQAEMIANGPGGELPGTLGMGPSLAWATPLEDADMADLRGGFNGVAFNFLLSGMVTDTGSAFELGGSGAIGDTRFEFAPDFGTTGGQVTIQTVVGDSLNGFRGIFQAANVIGDGVVIDQTLIMNVNVFIENTTAPTSFSFFGP